MLIASYHGLIQHVANNLTHANEDENKRQAAAAPANARDAQAFCRPTNKV